MDIVRNKREMWLLALCTTSFVLAFLLTHSLLVIKDKIVLAVEPDSCLGVSANQIDSTPPFGDGLIVPPGFAIDQISIKSGSTCFGPYSSDGIYEDDINGEDSCYQITGLETGNVSVVKAGTGDSETCTDISQIEVTWEDDSPTGTPTITPTGQPNSTPTPTEALIPTPTGSISITPTETIILSGTPTLTPTPENSTTATPTPTGSLNATNTPTPTGSVQGSSTTSNPGNNSSNNTQTGGQVLGASTLAGTGPTASTFAKIGIFLISISIYGLLQISPSQKN